MMLTVNVKMAFVANFFSNNNKFVVAFVAEINIKIVHDVIVVDVIRGDIIAA